MQCCRNGDSAYGGSYGDEYDDGHVTTSMMMNMMVIMMMMMMKKQVLMMIICIHEIMVTKIILSSFSIFVQ